MGRFADELEGVLAVRPEITDVADLLRVCYRVGREGPALIVIDEFPYLLPDGVAREQTLTAIQRVMEEERDDSQTKLLLCGSLSSRMESLLSQASPLHGRLVPLDVRPMTFAEASHLIEPDDDPATRITRYAVSGGMARHLVELGRGDLRDAVCTSVLDRRGPLFDDPRAVLEQELRQPATYFSILEALADGQKSLDHLGAATGTSGRALAPYLATLQAMRLVSQQLPVGAARGARGRRFGIDDGFIRFWFRFVFPHQDALHEGLRGADLWDGEISEFLPDHVAPTFEALCARYARLLHGHEAPVIGPWWGGAVHSERRAGRRTVEEIDIVGVHRKRLRLVGECTWTARPMRRQVLVDLLEWKLPALEQEGRLSRTREGPRVVLFSKSGFDEALVAAARSQGNVDLVDLPMLVETLEAGPPPVSASGGRSPLRGPARASSG